MRAAAGEKGRQRKRECPAAARPLCSTAALYRPRPAEAGARQHLLDQPARLRQHLVVAACRRTQDELGDPGIDVGGDPLDDGTRVADREMELRVTSGALTISLEQAREAGLVGPAEAERDAGAVMVVVDRAPLGGSRGANGGDDRRHLSP